MHPKDRVKRALNHQEPGRGYILSPGHPSLQADVPAGNTVAMYQAGFEYGWYNR